MGTSDVQGRMWGARAHDWADVQESVAEPLFAEILEVAAVGEGTTVLDVGCGSGIFCAMAAERGATVAGLDAAGALLEIARERVPEGDFRPGEMEALPHPDDSFDLVTGFSAFQFAASPVAAVREAARVARGGRVVVAVFGPRGTGESEAYLAALGSLLPPPPPGAPGPYALSGDGALETLAAEAGLAPLRTGSVDCPWVYPDEATALRGLLSSGPAVRAIDDAGEAAVRRAILSAIEPFRDAAGGYRLTNTFRYVVAARA